MQLWHGPIREFVQESTTWAIAPKMVERFAAYHGYPVGSSEYGSWEHSLHALGEVARAVKADDVGVVVEYHLPFSGQRIDAVFLGQGQSAANGLIVELKQWSKIRVNDEFDLNVIVEDREHAHPSQQALDYAGSLSNVHSAFVEGSLNALACSYCHNLAPADSGPLVGRQFAKLIQQSPVYYKGDDNALARHLTANVGAGDGVALMEKYISGRFRPSKKLLEILDATINRNEQWFLLGRQREAYNHIFAEVCRLAKKRHQSAVLVRGGPGTGKTVIAVQLLADTLRRGMSAAHATGGKAFNAVLRSKFTEAKVLFIYNMQTRNEAPQSIDLLLVDEAHRVRTTSDIRFTPTADRNRRSQMDELISAAKVCVFFLDENQFMRPDEIGCTKLVRDETARLKVPLTEYDLDVQFRCGGCAEYTDWVDFVLGYSPIKPQPWRTQYSCRLVASPFDLDQLLTKAKENGERARLVAGFCWPWSDPMETEALVHDVTIGNWSRPWNRKRNAKKNYKPENDSYTLWAETTVGEHEVGCVYSAQGFEFDRVGVIWGNDLVWRGKWVGQKDQTFDRPLRQKDADIDRLVRNAYRVLLTRGIKETWILCLDDQTRAHLRDAWVGMQPE